MAAIIPAVLVFIMPLITSVVTANVFLAQTALITVACLLPTVLAMKAVVVARVKPTVIASEILVRPTLTVEGLGVVAVPAFY